MKLLTRSLAALALCFGIATCQAQSQDGFIELIDGVNLSNWNFVGNANWIISDGQVMSDKGTGFLVSTESYKNFIIRAEFWVEPTTNSGIFIRCQDPSQIIATKNAYEVNIWDTRPGQEYATGAIVDIAKVNPVPHAGGHWNVMEIVANGSHFKVTLNGVVTVADGQDERFSQGRIALQSAGGIVKFRKLQIKPI